MLDYPADHGPIRFRTTTATPFHRGRAFRGSPLTGRLTIGAAALVTLAAAIGGVALLNSSRPGHGGNAATAGVPLPALARAPSGASSTPGAPVATHPHRTVKKVPASVAPVMAPVPASAPSRAAVAQGPPVVIRYVLDATWPSGFRGQVDVTNNTASPLADWQITLALYGDVVTSVQNATSFFGDGILLLQPGVNGQIVAPHGGTLSVSFVAEGVRTFPVACAFNGMSCM